MLHIDQSFKCEYSSSNFKGAVCKLHNKYMIASTQINNKHGNFCIHSSSRFLIIKP